MSIDDTFLINPAMADTGKTNTVFLFDCTGSVRGDFGPSKIFTKQADCVEDIYHKNDLDDAHVLWWNSDNEGSCFCTGGGVEFDPDEKMTVADFKSYANDIIFGRITNSCVTYTWLAFEKIPSKWIKPDVMTTVYLVTDGQIGWMNGTSYDKNKWYTELGKSLKKFFERSKNLRLEIVTVENVFNDYSKLETISGAAGCDIYEAIKSHGLTNKVSKFTSYSLNNLDGFVQYANVSCPPGHHPYKEYIFHDRDTNKFNVYIADQIRTNKENKDFLIDLINGLSKTIVSLMQDKTAMYKKSLLQYYISMFRQYSPSFSIARFVLRDAIRKGNAGKSDLHAQFRDTVTQLFKQADHLLKDDVKDALNVVSDKVMSLPIQVDGKFKVYTFPVEAMNKDLSIPGGTYPSACVNVDGKLVPMLPMNWHSTELSDQCMRQWVRALLGQMYGINVRSDTLMFMSFAIMGRVINSDASLEVKTAYRNICKVMLSKKRLNVNKTELDKYLEGFPPSSNIGKESEVDNALNYVRGYLYPKYNNYSMWYSLCHALGTEGLCNAQKIHCKHDLDINFPDMTDEEIVAKIDLDLKNSLEVVEAGDSSSLSYTCVYTGDDTSDTGGHCFKKHVFGGVACHPQWVLSDDGYEGLKRTGMKCPICRNNLSDDQFYKVGKLEFGDYGLTYTTPGVYKAGYNNGNKAYVYVPNVNIKAKVKVKVKVKAKTNKFLIFLRGPTGAGKTTTGKLIKKIVESNGGECHIVGTDQYCRAGIKHYEAVSLAHAGLNTFALSTINKPGLSVIVVDTCNDGGCSKKDVFKVDLSQWNHFSFFPNIYQQGITAQEKRNYYCWSLTNVLKRGKSNANTDHYLNPLDAGVGTCIQVTRKKFKGIYGRKSLDLDDNIPYAYENSKAKTRDVADKVIAMVEKYKILHDKYMKDKNHTLELQVEKFMEKKIIH